MAEDDIDLVVLTKCKIMISLQYEEDLKMANVILSCSNEGEH